LDGESQAALSEPERNPLVRVALLISNVGYLPPIAFVSR
jgi:hypothetical protein